MTNHPNRGRIPRPLNHLNAISKRYPQAWGQVDVYRQSRGKDLPDWPEWCFLPMAAWYGIVSADAGVDKLDLHQMPDVSGLAAMGAWRYTQGIYKLDSDLFDAVTDTVPKGALPTSVLLHMPEWSFYIETAKLTWQSKPIVGFWTHLEFDINTQRVELRLLLDTEDGLIPTCLHVGDWTITEAVDRFVNEAKKQAELANIDFKLDSAQLVESISSDIYPLVSLILYVCSDGVDYDHTDSRPSKPTPKRTKRGWRLFPAAKPHIWQLGCATGEAIRSANYTQHGKIPPHIRRAHWHGFWVGAGDDKKLTVKWLPPIAVASDNNTEQ